MLIEDYAIIGDMRTAAMVSREGSIDWLCLPRFDAASCFTALLGTPDNGFFRIAPVAQDVPVTRRYRDDSLVLETTFTTATGSVTLVDCMPVHAKTPSVVRIVKGIRGQVRMRLESSSCVSIMGKPRHGCAARKTVCARSPGQMRSLCIRRSRSPMKIFARSRNSMSTQATACPFSSCGIHRSTRQSRQTTPKKQSQIPTRIGARGQHGASTKANIARRWCAH